jgi:hypothetical protein
MSRLVTITDEMGHVEIERVGHHGGGGHGGHGGRGGRGRGGGFFFGPSYYYDDLDLYPSPWQRPRMVYLDELPPGVQVVR